MKGFFSRLFNVLCFIFAVFIFLPWQKVSLLISKIGLSSFGKYLEKHGEIKFLIIPLIALVISFIFLLVSISERKNSPKEISNKWTQNASYSLIYYIGIAGALSGVIHNLFAFINKAPNGFIILDNDYFELGRFVNNIPFLRSNISFLTGTFIFVILLLAQILIAIFNKAYKRGGFIKILNWLLLVVLSLFSLKGFTDFYSGLGSFIQLFKNLFSSSSLVEIEVAYNFEYYTFLIVMALVVILYVALAPIIASKNKRAYSEESKKPQEKLQNLTPYQSPFENHERIDDPLYELPRQEEVLETQIEEKAVIKQVLFEASNLDEIYETEFGFKNCSMVRGDAVTDYYVNKVKFLTLSNHNRTMSFRLELDKAIRLIIQYPLIGKDKYEDHKIWFKIEDASVLSKEVLVGIIRDAYTTVLNNV